MTLALLTMTGIALADVTHKVQAGETLSSVASKYGVSEQAITQANPKAKKYFYAGMELTIPTQAAAVAPSEPAKSEQPTVSKKQAKSEEPSVSNEPAPTQQEAPAVKSHYSELGGKETIAQRASERPSAGPGSVCPANQSLRASAKKNSMVVEYGDISAFRRAGNAMLTVDYSECMVEGKQTVDQYLAAKGGDWVKDWPQESANCHTMFCTMYSFRNKESLQISALGGTYSVVIRPTWVDFGDAGSQFNPFASAKAGGCIMTGTITLYDTDGQPLCQVYFNEIKGLGEFNFESRLRSMYQEMGTRLKKLVKK